jgi:hypothetical protein
MQSFSRREAASYIAVVACVFVLCVWYSSSFGERVIIGGIGIAILLALGVVAEQWGE